MLRNAEKRIYPKVFSAPWRFGALCLKLFSWLALSAYRVVVDSTLSMHPILTVNLTSGETGSREIPAQWEQAYLGGASLAARLLYEHLTPTLDPLSPQAPLLFLNGPLTGSAGPAVGRFVVCGKSPATGLWGESNVGGFWGPELVMAGYSGLWLSGRAARPVYLWIHDRQVEIRDAARLWGMDTYTTQAAIQASLAGSGALNPKPRVAVIGPAGERLIPLASILTDHGRMAGRTGLGAVMGSKNLKAVAVQGSGQVPLFDPAAYAPLRAASNRELRSDAQSLVLRELGSSSTADYFDYLGEMPKRYYHASSFPEEIKVSGAYMKDTILAGISACHACVIACGRVVRHPASDPAAPPGTPGVAPDGRRKGPEYETLVGFGPNLWLNDAVFASRMGELCDRYGVDTISLSNTIGLAFHLYELGFITPADSGGVELAWGSQVAAEALVHQVIEGRGLGEIVSRGARHLAAHFGAEEEAVQVNGLEVAYHDPRGASGMALTYATSPRGACHNQSDYFMVDIGQADPSLGTQYHPARSGPEKAASVAIHQDWRTVYNALVMCIFGNLQPDTVVSLINAACGSDLDIPSTLRLGERAWNLKRLINIRLGLRRQNDRLPRALLQPFPDDPAGEKGFAPPFESMLNAYYAARGWDPSTGFPTQQKLRQLELEWAVPDLYPHEA